MYAFSDLNREGLASHGESLLLWAIVSDEIFLSQVFESRNKIVTILKLSELWQWWAHEIWAHEIWALEYLNHFILPLSLRYRDSELKKNGNKQSLKVKI